MSARFFLALIIAGLVCGKANAADKCGSPLINLADQRYGTSNGTDYNLEVVGKQYGEFAAASSDTYSDLASSTNVPELSPRVFHLADDDDVIKRRSSMGKTGWRSLVVSRTPPYAGNRYSGLGGLQFDTYYKVAGDSFFVLVAYRGTRLTSLREVFEDTAANLSWVTQWLNPFDQYRAARDTFPLIRQAARAIAGNRRISFTATGHSLGGGLALHVAHRFECVTAVVFNASFVTNEALYGRYRPTTIFVYEDDDVLSRIAAISTQQANGGRFAAYRLNAQRATPDWLDFVRQHNAEQLAAGSMRYALTCLKRGTSCAFQEAAVAKTLYCHRYQGLRNRSDPEACR